MIIKDDPLVIQGYFEDASNLKGGHAEYVVLPKDTAEVSAFLREANQKKAPVTISGAGTGTSGGRIPFGGVVLSLEKLNKIKRISKSPSGGSVTLEAGVLIQDLIEAVSRNGLFYVCDPTEKTAFIGGTVATNASGARSFKYGATRRFTKGLELVLADGTVFRLRRGDFKAKKGMFDVGLDKRRTAFRVPTYKMPVVKNAAGYYAKEDMDLIDLFIGQEGTLAVITECELDLIKRPADIQSFFAFFGDEEKAIKFSEEARNTNALAIEYFDRNSVGLLRDKNKNIPPYARSSIFFEEELEEKSEEVRVLDKWQGLLLKYGVSIDDTWVAMTENQRDDFYRLRHSVPEMINEKVKQNKMPKLSTDIAVPGEKFFEMLELYKRAVRTCGMEYFLFGHIGDSHLHFNLLPTTEKLYGVGKDICMTLVKKAVSLGGTVSAEHGIGKMRHEYLKVLYGDEGISQMLAVKKALDPNCILGRGNIIPEKLLS